MGDPDLRSEETVLVRTQGVYVKSIPFEGIITNKRIILIDRAKNLLPPKEIPLATIKEVESGENAINDPVVTVTVITRTGETRQMVLTFSRTAGDNANTDWHEWVKTLKENVSPSSRVEITRNPVLPAYIRHASKHDVDPVHPIKNIIENAPSKIPDALRVHDTPALGMFCSHCGNQVPEGSGFCNRCGSSIIPPVNSPPAIPEYRAPVKPALPPVDRDIQTIDHIFDRSPGKVSADSPIAASPESPVQKPAQRAYSPMYDNPPEDEVMPETVPAPAPVVTRQPQKPAKKPLIHRLFSPKELIQTPLSPPSTPKFASPPPQKLRSAIRMPRKKIFLAIGVIILLIVIVVVGVVFVYPMISGSGSAAPGPALGSSATTPTQAKTSNPVSSGAIVVRETTAAARTPATGVYAHVNYLGSWKVSYGMPTTLKSVSDSGDKFLEIVNATGPVQVTAEKLDSSTRHDLVVEIYKNGGLLTTGKTNVAYDKVTVSADATTGVAQAPKTVSGTVTLTKKQLTKVTKVKATSSPASGVTTIKATAPSVKTTALVTNTTRSSK
ncbi:MAG: zinc-ribbon domain-containing protein [Methanomicrobiales archaeon]